MEEYISTHIRLEKQQYNRLRDEAHETRRSQSEIIREALKIYWAQKEKKEERGWKNMLIGVVLTCTAHGKPVWRIYDVNRESPEDVLIDRGVHNPPPYRVIGPYDVPSDDETVVKEAVTNDPTESVDLDDPRTWFPDVDWIDRYLTE